MLDGLPVTGGSARFTRVRARAGGRAAPIGADGFCLLVDLSNEPVGPLWARGAATLALLCGAALALAPGFKPFAPARANTIPIERTFQLNPMLSAEADHQPIASDPETEGASTPIVASNSGAIRVRGPVIEGLYWSLREAGVSSEAAADYLKALSMRIDVGAEVAPYDRFDLVISKTEGRPLLYAALHRADGPDVELMKWKAGGQSGWFDANAGGETRSTGLMAPVSGRVTSSYGVRRHPILGFARFHSGVDFGARWGSPIAAAADGVVIASGWAGGYGRQVRVAHGSGIVTSYSHMSGVAASPGEMVRQGQVIGYVGSTGLSTGPHLHFEVRIGGRAVDPAQVRLQRRPVLSGAERQAFNARLKQLMAIGNGA